MINGIPQYNAILCSGINAKLITTILFVIKAKIGTIGYNGVLYILSPLTFLRLLYTDF